MNALITGIEGFVGPHLAKVLLEKKYAVCGTYLGSVHKKIEGVNYVHLDVTDKKEATRVISKIRPDYIFHLAGFSSVSLSWKNPERCFEINVEGTRNLLDAVLAAKISPTILIVSSAEVYGKPVQLPITENHPTNPVSPYAKSRLEQEKVVLEYVNKKRIRAIISRSFNHTGPGQAPIFVCSSFAYQIARIKKGLQEPVIKTGDLSVTRDFTNVRDVVTAYVLAVEKCTIGEIYNICSGKAYSIKEILDMLILISGKKDIRVVTDPEKVRPVDVPVLFGSNSKISLLSGWAPAIDIQSTLSEVYSYFLENV